MATVKKGVLTKPRSISKHLRPFGKKVFWNSERAKELIVLRKESRYAEGFV